jgi:beta-N-acetylhexosaminidase
MLPAIVALSGLSLSDAERDLFLTLPPFGFILFRRNCESVDQVRALTRSLADLFPQRDVPIMIDQEGGRVQRLPWCHLPAVGSLKTDDALVQHVQTIADQLLPVGITVNALPLLDLRLPDQDPIIGDRAFAGSQQEVARQGQIVIDAHQASGLIPIMKHIPGHGRATCDSHIALPVVTESRDVLQDTDFLPFRLCRAPWAMTAHVVYTALDDQPATLSPKVIQDVIRDDMGFDGLLLSDDLGMHALSGSLTQRTHGALNAGCDIALHCSGNLVETREVLRAAGETRDTFPKRVLGGAL